MQPQRDRLNLPLLQSSAVLAAQTGGAILKRYFRKQLQISEKKGAGLVTNADFESQEAIVKILKKNFPEFGFLTEEAKPELSDSPGRWIIDPLDGTTNFVHGFPMFCVSIAAEWRGEIVAGVIYHPILGDLYTATLGKGAKLNGKRITTSKTTRLRESLVTTGFTYNAKDFLNSEINSFKSVSKVTRGVRRPGSAALDLAYTASGVFDGFWERGLSPWDVAAGLLLVREAGGKVTNFEGKPFQIEEKEILATNTFLHSTLLKQVSKK